MTHVNTKIADRIESADKKKMTDGRTKKTSSQ